MPSASARNPEARQTGGSGVATGIPGNLGSIMTINVRGSVLEYDHPAAGSFPCRFTIIRKAGKARAHRHPMAVNSACESRKR